MNWQQAIKLRLAYAAAFFLCNCGDRAGFLPHKSWCRAKRLLWRWL